MYLLITYDVSTMTKDGQRRLRRIAKICKDYGQRVQNSVFECKVDPAQWVELKSKLLSTADLEEDSLRFYHLGKHWEERVEHFGAKSTYNIDGPLIL